MKWLKHILALALAGVMLFMGMQKFGADNPIFATIAQNTGIALFEPVIRMFSGVMEVLAGLLMFHPKTRGAGATLATGVVAGAIFFHLTPWLGTKVSMGPGLEATYALFTMAIAFFVLSLVNLGLNLGSIPVVGRLFTKNNNV